MGTSEMSIPNFLAPLASGLELQLKAVVAIRFESDGLLQEKKVKMQQVKIKYFFIT